MEGLSGHRVDLGVALLAAMVVAVVWWLRRKHRRTAAAAATADAPTPLDPALHPPQLAWLDAVQRERWQQQVQRFLQQKRFVGCAGLRLSAHHAKTIAGIACLLRLQAGAEQQPLFPTVREVLVYPDVFLVPPQAQPIADDGLEVIDDAPDERIGEHGPGQVVLSWADVCSALEGDHVNVVIHEFAHALDSENPDTEGAPELQSAEDYARWSAAMSAEFARLRRHRRPPVLDPYGAESPAEFWCVVAEAFFQQPVALARHHAVLHALLADYLQLAAPGATTAASAPPVEERLAPADGAA